MRRSEDIHKTFDRLVKMHNKAISMSKFGDYNLSEPAKVMLQVYITKVAGVIQALDWVINEERDEPDDWNALDRVL